MHAASQTLNSKLQITILISMLSLLIGCSRDNPLSTPDEYIEPETPFCTDDSPYSFQLLEGIEFTNINNDLMPIDEEIPAEPQENKPSENNRQMAFTVTAPFLSNETRVTPLPLTDYKRDEFGNIILNDENEPTIILINKEITQDMRQNLSEDALAELDAYIPEIVSISVSIEYTDEGERITEAFDDELISLDADLLEGVNEFTLTITASVIVPKTGLECVNDSDGSQRLVNLNYVVNYTITRTNINDFSFSALNSTGFLIKENDELGRVIAVNDDFLILGLPNEGSDLQGVHTVNGLTQSNDAVQSGAALVFSKDETDNWAPHSIIKSSNNQAGDRFGTAISLDGSIMVISAPGEDSNASGIHSNASSNTAALKVNNSAADSGAVYVFRYDDQANSWTETHYIKPNENVVSGGSFNKQFGEKLAVAHDLLLISAPGEDSTNGNPADSSIPDSGVVYAYSLTTGSPMNLSFISPLKAFNPGPGDLFGTSLALTDRFIAIGAPYEDNDRRAIENNLSENNELDKLENDNRPNSGAVYLFSSSANNTEIEPYAYLKSSNSDAGDFFGASLAIDETSVFVGAPGEDSNGTGFNRDMGNNSASNSGAVYVFNLDQTSWLETNYIKADDTQAESTFGQYIGFNKNNLVVSSPTFDSVLDENAGKVYLFEYKQGQLSFNNEFNAVGEANNMLLGKKIAINNKHLIIGASAFTATDSETSSEIPFSGKVLSYQ